MNGGSSHVVVFRGTDLTVLLTIFAYDPLIRGGVFVAAGDINGDGRAEIITGDGATSPEVKLFDGRTGEGLGHFFAFDPNLRGGVNVGVTDFHGDGQLDLVVAAGSGGGSEVEVFDPRTQTEEDSFSPCQRSRKARSFSAANPGASRARQRCSILRPVVRR